MNVKKSLIIIAFIVAIFFAFGFQNSSEHKVLFEKAKFTMETKGDLKGAISLFEQIIKKYPDEREYAAKSQLYIGLCYEKLGLREAQKAFQKVIDNYPEQAEAVKVANEKLSLILRAQSVVEKGDKEFRIRKVMPLDIMGAPSPDGHLLSFVDWETGCGELAVIEIATGEKRRLTRKASGEKSWYFVNHSIFSPDGKKLAFTQWKDDNTIEFCTINVDGSAKHILLNNREIYYFWPDDWTPDGNYILGILTKKDKTNQMAYVSVSEGNVRIIKEFGYSKPGRLSLSPNSRWIAYDLPQNEQSEKRDILLLAVDGSREIPLVKHPADDRLIGWALSGDWILFSSNRSGTWDAWVVNIKDGKKQGNTRLVKRNFGQMDEEGIVPMGFTQKGSFYYGVRGLLMDVYVAVLDAEKVELLNLPKKAVRRLEGFNSNPDWSPDGKYLAYISRGVSEPKSLKSSAICIVSMDTGEELELFPELKYLDLLSWFPDGKSFLVWGRDKDNWSGLFKVDARTGQVSLIVAGDSGYHSPRISPDAKKIFYESDSWEKKIFRIIRYDLEAKRKKEIYRSPWQIIRMDISPDGKWLAFSEIKDNTLKIIPVEGGESQVLLELEPGTSINSVAWSPNGKYIFFSKVEKGGGKTGKCELWRIPWNGGKPLKFELEVDGLIGMSFHPDGRRIAFVSVQANPEVWIMENFLPEEKPQK